MKNIIKNISISVIAAVYILTISTVYRYHYLTTIARNKWTFFLSFIIYTVIIYGIIIAIQCVKGPLFEKLNEVSLEIENRTSPKTQKIITISFVALIVLVYFCVYFAYYPGTAAYDYKTSFQQAMGLEGLSDHHPVFYTFLWKIMQIITSITGKSYYADVLYAVLQILVVLFTCRHIVIWLRKKGIPLLCRTLAGLYFLMVPTLHLFAFSPTKDVPFACALVFFATALVDYAEDGTHLVSLYISGILACLLRHNMVYIIAALIVVLLIIRVHLKKVALALLPVIVASTLISKITISTLNIAKTEPAEYLSAPIQQISALYKFEAYFTEEERSTIRAYITRVDDYNYRFADMAKNSLNNSLYQQNPSDFWKVYFSGLRQNPIIYFCAFLDTNSPLLYPGSDIIDAYNGREYIELNQNPGSGDFFLSRTFSFIKEIYDKVGSGENEFMDYPMLHGYFSLSFPFYSLLIALVALMGADRKKERIICWIYLLLLGTYVLGPVANYRYCYPIYLAVPLYLGTIFRKSVKES